MKDNLRELAERWLKYTDESAKMRADHFRKGAAQARRDDAAELLAILDAAIQGERHEC